MTRRFEVGPILVALAAIVLLVSLFLDWYGGLTAWEAFEVVEVMLAALAVTALVIAVGLLVPDLEYVERRWLPAVVLGVVLLVAAEIVDPPPAAGDQAPATGAWMALGSAVVMFAGALLTFGRVSLAVSVEEPQRARAGRRGRPPAGHDGERSGRRRLGRERGAGDGLMPEVREVAFELERFAFTRPTGSRSSAAGPGSQAGGSVARRSRSSPAAGGSGSSRFPAATSRRTDGAEWRVAFAYDGDPEALASAELVIGRRLVVDLPAPRRRRAGRAPTGGRERAAAARGGGADAGRARGRDRGPARRGGGGADRTRRPDRGAARAARGTRRGARRRTRRAEAARADAEAARRTPRRAQEPSGRAEAEQARAEAEQAPRRPRSGSPPSAPRRPRCASGSRRRARRRRARSPPRRRRPSGCVPSCRRRARRPSGPSTPSARRRRACARSSPPGPRTAATTTARPTAAARRMYERIARELENERAAARCLRRELDAVQAQTAEHRRVASAAAATGIDPTDDAPAAATPAGRLVAARRTEVGRAAAHHRAEAARAAAAHRVPESPPRPSSSGPSA